MAGRFADALDAGLGRVADGAWLAAQTAVAATIAVTIATYVLGHHQPVFAGIACVVALGTTRGERARRAFELVSGILIGITVADLLALAIPWTLVRIPIAAALAMTTALLLGKGNILVNQAAVWAILVSTIPPVSGELVPSRFFDGLVGVTTAMIFSQLLFPLDPLAELRKAAVPVTGQLADALDMLADALRTADRARAREALDLARALDGPIEDWRDAVGAATETARMAPARRRARRHVEPHSDLVRQIDYASRNTRVLARAIGRLLREGHEVPPSLPDAVAGLAEATRAIGRQLQATGPEKSTVARTQAISAAMQATRALPNRKEMALAVIVGQIRSTALDLLRATGLDLPEAQNALDDAEAGLR
jgi:uncharacterized membrane protein YgaE (UPF0421/DUF939 family)